MGTSTPTRKELNAQLVNDVMLKAEGRPESVTNPVGMIVTRNGKLRENGHPVTVKYFENEFYAKMEIWLESHTAFAVEVLNSDFDEIALSSYASGAYQIAIERLTAE